jgi:hypothetical protein
MYESIKSSRFRIRGQLREVHKVTQWKEDCIYRTKSIGIISCTPDYADYLRLSDKNILVGSISTKLDKIINS